MSALLLPLGLTLGPPLLLSALLVFIRPPSRLDWLLEALPCAGAAVYLSLASPIWIWVGIGWRYVLLVPAVAAIAWSARHQRTRPVLPRGRPKPLAGTALRCAVVALIAVMLVDLRMAHVTPAGAVDLSFPLAGGRFAVIHGGGSVALNYHRIVPAQAYAIDLVALNSQGRRARGARPEAFDAYEIFDRPVTAPCDGLVSGMSDGAPDTPIGGSDQARPAGNHVLLSCGAGGAEVSLLLAHFRPGSVAVARGDPVRRGELLGRVGSSGNSTEPHLHVHAVRGRETDLRVVIASAEAVPLTFDGRFLTRNAVVHIPDLP